MLNVNNLGQDYQYFFCNECKRRLKICQIQRKVINTTLEFGVFIYYCKRCKLTYFIFKFGKKVRGDN